MGEKNPQKNGYYLSAFLDGVLVISDALILQSIDEVHSVMPRSQYSYFY